MDKPGGPYDFQVFKSDRDKDGIPDKEDSCPDEAGLATLGGCPDKDGDGVADNVDDCHANAAC